MAADTTAPAIVSTSKTSASTFTVKFSEPVKTLGTVSYKLADGTDVSAKVSEDFAAGAQEVTFTLGDIEAGKEVIATFIGAQDQAGNLLTPNPATVSFVKGNKDGVAPTVSSITQTGAKTFTVKFSEQLLSNPTVTVNSTAAAKVEKDSANPLVYTVTAADVLDGASTVAISSFTDLTGEVGTNVSKVVTFAKETAAPKVTSSNVVVDSKTNKQYLELTFDKDVLLDTPTVDGTGSFVKNYVTTTVGADDLAATPVSYKDANNKKVVRVELDTFLGGTNTDVEGAVYTLDLTFAGVESATEVAADSVKVTFTRGKDGVVANEDVTKVAGLVQDANNNSKINVTFDKAVDGASATNVANYKIDGAVVESVTLLPATTAGDPAVTTQVAVLNLKAGSNKFTGPRNISITGVKALGSSKVMEEYFANNISLNENVAPVVTSAKLTATNAVTLTFSEAVTDTTGLDFELYIGGKAQAVAEKVDAGIGSTPVTSVVVTIPAVDADELAKGVSLKALTDTLDIEDAVGNKLSVSSNIVVSQ